MDAIETLEDDTDCHLHDGEYHCKLHFVVVREGEILIALHPSWINAEGIHAILDARVFPVPELADLGAWISCVLCDCKYCDLTLVARITEYIHWDGKELVIN